MITEMSVRCVPRVTTNDANWKGLRHCSTAPNLHIPVPTPPRRRGSVAELMIPKRKDSITFFVSPQRNRKNVTWSTSTHSGMNKRPLSNVFSKSLRTELEEIDEIRMTPRQPKRQNGMVRLTPTPDRRKGTPSVLVLPRISRPLV
mmetsp:Transcript_3953/g.9430  ORF Transcript_3953/g.9430 Transcript_3953/m.9430 type:complete len:145 (-) Transcript_3953:187-621(-)